MPADFSQVSKEQLEALDQVHEELIALCHWLNEGRDTDTASRLIPIVDRLTEVLIKMREGAG